MKAVFTAKLNSEYDDLPEVRYHFPQTYLRQVERAVGDWVVYYEPRREGGRQVYFAVAMVDRVVADPINPALYYAELSNYLPLDRPVPFREGSSYYESLLRKEDGSTNKGAFGRAVRNMSDAEFDAIWLAGFSHVIGLSSRLRHGSDAPEEPLSRLPGVGEPAPDHCETEPEEQHRRIVKQLVSRPFRDRAFAVAVKDAYHDTCAMTGLKLINGGGRSEVQAAHIRPVEHRGPDSVRNGIALSGTMHWMFDRGLISVDDDYSLLFARDRLPDTIERLLGGNDRLLLPQARELQPHPQFLAYHRREIFKG